MKSGVQFLEKSSKAKLLVFFLAVLCFLPIISAPIALGIGILCTFLLSSIKDLNLQFLSNSFLKVSIVLMGFGMSWSEAVKSSSSGFILTALSVSITLIIGILLGKILKVDGKTTLLIASGTAICGGSAIVAVSPVIQAKNQQLSFALIVIFVLNALALVLFPIFGQLMNLSQEVFGNWAAIAIHDTTSVVGAGEAYGNEALEIATTVKLTRALWIIPMAITLSLTKKNGGLKAVKTPWFILLFVLAMVTAHRLPSWHGEFEILSWLGRRGMVMALLFIGLSMRVSEIRKAGPKPFFLGITLWATVSVLSLIALNNFF